MKLFKLSGTTCSAQHTDFKETQIVVARQAQHYVRLSARRMPQGVNDVKIFAHI